MALLTIHTFPDPILKKVTQPVTEFDENLKTLTENMLETMYASHGIGLAAIQVAVLKRVIVIDIESGAEDQSLRQPMVLVNPQILEYSGEILYEEGCLSVIDFRAEIQRAKKVLVEYQDIQGTTQQMIAEDLKAVCLQHELDHLDGILFIDHLPVLKQKMVKKKLTKRAAAEAA